MELKIQDKGFVAFLLACFLIISIFLFVFFGMTGFRVFLGIILVSLPIYLIIDTFDLSSGEKFVFSFILGITVYPSLVYALGLLIPFRMSIAVVFVFLMLIAIILRKFKKKSA